MNKYSLPIFCHTTPGIRDNIQAALPDSVLHNVLDLPSPFSGILLWEPDPSRPPSEYSGLHKSKNPEEPAFLFVILPDESRSELISTWIQNGADGCLTHSQLHSGSLEHWISERLELLKLHRSGHGSAVTTEKNPEPERKDRVHSGSDTSESASIRHQRAFLKQIIDLNPNIIFVKDKHSRYLLANKKLADTYGVTTEEIKGKTDSDFMVNRQEATVALKTDRSVITKNEPVTVPEYSFTHPETGEEQWYECIKVPMTAPDGSHCILGIATEITSRLENEHQLEKAKRNAEQADLLKSQFLSNMGHEIRTPLNAILGFTEVIQSLVDDPELTEYLGYIDSSGHQLLNLINDILDLSKIEAGRMELSPEPFTIRDMLNECKSLHEDHCAKKNLNFDLIFDENLPGMLIMDEKRLQQILLNLIDNAVKFTPAGGITLSASTTGNLRRDSGDPDHNPVTDLVISVSDTGIGIPDEFHEEIFKNFFRQGGKEKSKYKGTGLGLAITKRLTEMLNGDISLESSPGDGSTFTLVFHDIPVSGHIEADTTISNAAHNTDTVTPSNDTWFIGLIGFSKSELSRIRRKIVIPDAVDWSAAKPLKAVDHIESTPTEVVLLNPARQDSFYHSLTEPLQSHKIIPLLMDMDNTKPDPSWSKNNADAPLLLSILEPESAVETIQQLRTKRAFSGNENISLLSKEEKDEISEIIPQTIIPQWNRLKNRLVIGDIAKFASMIAKTGEHYQIDEFIRYGQKLHHETDRMDIEKIRSQLSVFGEIVEKIEHELKTS